MTHRPGILSELKKSFAPPVTGAPDPRFRLINVTRDRQLAGNVEIAQSGARRSKGLLGRTGLGPGEALWIVPCEAIHTIGMQFAIDLIYLDRQYRVRKIRSSVPPWRFSGCLSAHSVVELAAGAIQPDDAAPGDILEFRPIDGVD